jgi:hypothetical protein
MTVNVCGLDRIIRLTLGVLLVAWIGFADGPVWAWIGVLGLVTGVLSFCPLYTMAGMSTCQNKTDET